MTYRSTIDLVCDGDLRRADWSIELAAKIVTVASLRDAYESTEGLDDA